MPEASIRFPASKANVVCGSGVGGEPVDLALNKDPSVAPRQVRFEYWLGTWWIENLESACPLYLRGQEINTRQQLRPGDTIALGGYLLRIPDLGIDPAPPEVPGWLNVRLSEGESQLITRITPDEQLNVLVGVTDIAAVARTRQSLLEGFLRELTRAFPAATRCSILLIEDRELVVRVSLPEPSTVSFTLARDAIQKKESFVWKATPGSLPAVTQLDTLCALYAPMINAGRVLGTLYLGSHLKTDAFSERDLSLCSVIGNTMAAAFGASDSSATRLPQVFLSYAHADRDFVNRLVGDLRRRQVKVWFDERLQTGETWRRKLATAIKTTDAFVFLLSPQSVRSKIATWELATAQKLRKPVFPLLYEQCDIPVPIRPLQHQSVAGSDENRGLALNQLVEQLRNLRGRRA